MIRDPRLQLADLPMRPLQILVVAITVGLSALDGFDVLAISFAAPGIAREWGIDRAALGFVLSMELFGMAGGAITLGALADRFGRRNTMLVCLSLMMLGMAAIPTSRSILMLCIWRIVTGLGVGGMLATSNAVAAEFSNTQRRDLCVSLMVIGYPLGAIGGGSIAAVLLQSHDWRTIFEFGALMTALFIPLVLLRVPESVMWLCDRQPAQALSRLNRSLRALKMGEIAELPPLRIAAHGWRSLLDIFSPALASTTVLLTAVYCLHFITFYFILKWVPKIVVDMGFSASSAAGVLVWANVGGVVGSLIVGFFSRRIGLKALTLCLLLSSTVMVILFGHGHEDLRSLSILCAIAGLCTSGGGTGIYAVVARAFPADVRGSGTGFVIGIGRGGSVLAPIIAGYLFSFGYGLQTVATVMGLGSLLAAACLLVLPVKSDLPAVNSTRSQTMRSQIQSNSAD
jgi:benzoate transport